MIIQVRHCPGAKEAILSGAGPDCITRNARVSWCAGVRCQHTAPSVCARVRRPHLTYGCWFCFAWTRRGIVDQVRLSCRCPSSKRPWDNRCDRTRTSQALITGLEQLSAAPC